VLCLLATQGNRVAEQSKLDRITANRSTGKFHLGTLDQSQDHQSLYVRIGAGNIVYNVLVATLQGVECHVTPIRVIHFETSKSTQMRMIRNSV